jgi:hypothetical protein
MCRRGVPRKAIAAELGRTEEAIQKKLYKLFGTRAVSARSRKQLERRHYGASFFVS